MVVVANAADLVANVLRNGYRQQSGEDVLVDQNLYDVCNDL